MALQPREAKQYRLPTSLSEPRNLKLPSFLDAPRNPSICTRLVQQTHTHAAHFMSTFFWPRRLLQAARGARYPLVRFWGGRYHLQSPAAVFPRGLPRSCPVPRRCGQGSHRLTLAELGDPEAEPEQEPSGPQAALHDDIRAPGGRGGLARAAQGVAAEAEGSVPVGVVAPQGLATDPAPGRQAGFGKMSSSPQRSLQTNSWRGRARK